MEQGWITVRRGWGGAGPWSTIAVGEGGTGHHSLVEIVQYPVPSLASWDQATEAHATSTQPPHTGVGLCGILTLSGLGSGWPEVAQGPRAQSQFGGSTGLCLACGLTLHLDLAHGSENMSTSDLAQVFFLFCSV